MNPPAWGIPVVIVVGALVVILGTLWDRRRARADAADAAQATQPSSGLVPTNEPRYVDEVALPDAAPPDDVQAELALLDRRAQGWTLPGGVPDGRFLNHARQGLAILPTPSVLVTDADASSQRDLVTVLEAARRRGRPLVWVARSFSSDIVASLRANAVTHRLSNVPIELADPLQLRRAVAYTGGRLVTAADLAADYLPDAAWGTCDGWIADVDDSWVLPPEPDADVPTA